jgi:hypothetical protein
MSEGKIQVGQEVMPVDENNVELYRASRQQAFAMWAMASAINRMADNMAPVTAIVLKQQQTEAVSRSWKSAYAILLPFLSIAVSAFVTWYMK